MGKRFIYHLGGLSCARERGKGGMNDRRGGGKFMEFKGEKRGNVYCI